MKVVALMYHDVFVEHADESGFPGGDAALYKVRNDAFVAQLQAIAASRIGHVVTAHTMIPGPPPSPNNDARPLLLTADDGGRSAYTHLAPAFEQHGWRGHFFVATDQIDTPTFLARSQIRELVERGHIVGSHSASHPLRMAKLSDAQLLDEWRRSLDVLTQISGRPVTVASVPGGLYSRAVGEAASRAGIETLFTSEPVSSLGRIDNCRLIGRYSIQSWMKPRLVAAIASGARLPRWRQLAFWNAKKITKAIGGELYLAVRKQLLARRH